MHICNQPHHIYLKIAYPNLECFMKDGGAVSSHKGHTFSLQGFFTTAPMTVGVFSGRRQWRVKRGGKGVEVPQAPFQTASTQDSGLSASPSPLQTMDSSPPPHIHVQSTVDPGNCGDNTNASACWVASYACQPYSPTGYIPMQAVGYCTHNGYVLHRAGPL